MSNYAPLVSILVPVYNASLYLRTCLDSIINQSYRNLQIVLIDDGSKDDSLSICQHYAFDDRIEVYTQENKGVSITRNTLLDKAIGEYVLFVDSDDWLELNMVEHLVSVSVEFNAEITLCEKIINDSPVISRDSRLLLLNRDQSIADFLIHRYFDGSLWNKLIKRDITLDSSFLHEVSYGEDALFIWDILLKVNRVAVTPKQLYHYRINQFSLSANYSGHQFTAFYVWDKICKDIVKLYPHLDEIAKSQYCNQMVIILYNAAKYGYKNDFNIKKACDVIKMYKKFLRNTGHSMKKYVFACIISEYYALVAKMLKRK